MSSAGMAALAPLAARAQRNIETDEFEYEVTRSEAEWREMLSDEEYVILRRGSTELPGTSPELVSETRDGMFACKGCELPVFGANWKVPLDKGWVFFTHAEPNSVLTGIDGAVREYGMAEGSTTLVEIHCRRCGSHLGHYLNVAGQNVHCINGLALNFAAA
ncbi:peptide-methionine (R)-S-oxide reductase [Jannaschia ovalis]|uniref:peptide-methionine (R)-S-oxide reductase n=1 Tax=Jannaschia ovalis TaxID=3038773 RepID=A0ABY8LCX7_9RHOB|nr:peptide-methionine (R)-S-oxide reductase [Jannaschia sp. GRR-S6-38]WGH79181.1 peptide-methionine (R)-S-oxide reductase [Jannaschia sp. GRR-S6-38]